jgi:uncharacterized protein
MAGTIEGGKATAASNKAKYGDDFYKRIGKLSQKAWAANGRKPRGFSVNPDLARTAGAKGGRRSRRTKRAIV